MARTKKKKYSGVDPAYIEKQKDSLKRKNRKTVFLNGPELAALDEYCKRFKVTSRSALIRNALMKHILTELDKNQPTLF
ncbi:MAG: hypothetical protein J5764_06720 [Bacteroidales bacterium]|nr:hypothetical protein [Bacteroidales bacterium]